jgi:hypothetical protein
MGNSVVLIERQRQQILQFKYRTLFRERQRERQDDCIAWTLVLCFTECHFLFPQAYEYQHGYNLIVIYFFVPKKFMMCQCLTSLKEWGTQVYIYLLYQQFYLECYLFPEDEHSHNL